MPKVRINPQVIQWARETAGLSLVDAARKLAIGFANDQSPAQRLEALESGEEAPTRALLIRMSKQYRRPLIAFYMEEPPTKADRGEDFRRLPDGYTEAEEALVDALLRDIKARQEIVRAALIDEENVQRVQFVGVTNREAGVPRVAEIVRTNIGFDINFFRRQKNSSDAFAYLRACAEEAGVFVLLIGDLGSRHTRLSVEAFRGFAVSDNFAPFVVINDQDAKAAWSFSLLHELAHICLGKTGISGAIPENVLERFCNEVASTILLPAAELNELEVNADTDFNVAINRIINFSKPRKISRSMVAYKLFTSGRISFERWNEFRLEFRREWLEYRADLRQQARDDEGGPNYYVVRRQRLGSGLLNLVSRMLNSGILSSTKAGKVLGVKPQNVYELVHSPR